MLQQPHSNSETALAAWLSANCNHHKHQLRASVAYLHEAKSVKAVAEDKTTPIGHLGQGLYASEVLETPKNSAIRAQH